MTIEPNTFEFSFLFILVLIVIAVKIIMSIYLGIKVRKKKKEEGEFKLNFLFSIFILAIAAAVSRAIYTYYDFFLVGFDPDQLWRYPNVIYWKYAGFISALGLVFVLYTIDKKVLSNKFKGILAYYALFFVVLQFVWPINSKADFETASLIGVFGIVAFAIIPIIFLYLAIKTPGLRKECLMMFLGIIIYAFGSLLVSENFLAAIRDALGEQIDVTIYTIFYVSKIVGISLLAFGVSQFSL